MTITRQELLRMKLRPRGILHYHVDTIVRAVESFAENGETFYLDGPFPEHMSELFYDIVYKLSRIFIDSEIYTLQNFGTGELTLTIDWLTIPRTR